MTGGENDGKRTALVVVDLQGGFVGTESHAGVEGAAAVVAAVRHWAEHATEHDWPIFWTRDVDPFPVPDHDPEGLLDLHRLRTELDGVGTVVDKGPGARGGMSGFVLDHEGPGSGNLSALATELARAEVDHVVVVGLAADVCVAATARDARRLGYAVTVPREATAFVHAHPDGDAAALDELVEAGCEVM